MSAPGVAQGIPPVGANADAALAAHWEQRARNHTRFFLPDADTARMLSPTERRQVLMEGAEK